jgi:adhesin HecA-like repeat protein
VTQTNGVVSAGRSTSLTSRSDLNLSGSTVQSQGNVTLTGDTLNLNTATVRSGADVSLSAAHGIDASDSQIGADDSITASTSGTALKADGANWRAMKNIDVTTGAVSLVGGGMVAGQNLGVSADSLAMPGGSLQAGDTLNVNVRGDADISSGLLTAGKQLTVNAGSLYAGGTGTAAKIVSGGQLSLTTDQNRRRHPNQRQQRRHRRLSPCRW